MLVERFEEKPASSTLHTMSMDAGCVADAFGLCGTELGARPYVASMGIYVFKKQVGWLLFTYVYMYMYMRRLGRAFAAVVSGQALGGRAKAARDHRKQPRPTNTTQSQHNTTQYTTQHNTQHNTK